MRCGISWKKLPRVRVTLRSSLPIDSFHLTVNTVTTILQLLTGPQFPFATPTIKSLFYELVYASLQSTQTSRGNLYEGKSLCTIFLLPGTSSSQTWWHPGQYLNTDPDLIPFDIVSIIIIVAYLLLKLLRAFLELHSEQLDVTFELKYLSLQAFNIWFLLLYDFILGSYHS